MLSVATWMDLEIIMLIKRKTNIISTKVFPVVTYRCELDHKEGWAPKNWCFWTVVLEKTLESPLDCKEIKPVSPKGNQPWIFTGRTDAEAEAPILWLADEKSQLIEIDPAAGKDWEGEGGKGEEKGVTEDEMVGQHHRLNGHEFEQIPGEWRTGKPGVLQSMGLQRTGHDWATEQ